MEQDPPKPLLSSRRPWHLVQSEFELAAAVKAMHSFVGPFALDAERASGFKYSQRAYLIQVARRESEIYLIDPTAFASDSTAMGSLVKMLNEEAWILHAATQDLPCLAELGLIPSKIIDTELGSRLAGLPRVGLGAVVENYLQLSLAKEHSAVDWSTRPLNAAWLEYAALDVDVLHELADALMHDLKQQDKFDFATEEFDHLLRFKPKAEKLDRWRGVSGLHEVKDQHGLAIARELWLAREKLAQKLDVSPGRLIPDSSISHVAKIKHRSRPELAADKSFAGRASRSYLDTWWDAIQAGANSLDLPPLRIANQGIPNHRSWPSKFPAAHKRLHLAKEVVSSIQESLSIPAENLLTPDFLRQICFTERPDVSEQQVAAELAELGARKWQRNLLAREIATAISKAAEFEFPPVIAED